MEMPRHQLPGLGFQCQVCLSFFLSFSVTPLSPPSLPASYNQFSEGPGSVEWSRSMAFFFSHPLLCCISLSAPYGVMGSNMTSGHFQLLEPPLAWSETSVSELCQSFLLEWKGGTIFSPTTLPAPVSPISRKGGMRPPCFVHLLAVRWTGLLQIHKLRLLAVCQHLPRWSPVLEVVSG